MEVTTNATGTMHFDTWPETPSELLYHQRISGSKGQISIKKDKLGDSFWVLPVDQGDYTWSQFGAALHLGNWLLDTDGSNHFKIKAGTVNYIGHLYIDAQPGRMSIQVTNEYFAMKEFLAANYPEYSNSMPFEAKIVEGNISSSH